MINLLHTTFIIPVQIESNDREFNFMHNIQYLCNNFETNIIIGEADVESKVKALLTKINRGKSNILHIFEPTRGKTFHRTKILNQMLNRVKTPITVNYDIDVFMHPDAYVDACNMILKQNYDLVYPYLHGHSQKQIFAKGKQQLSGGVDIEELDHEITIAICGHCQFFNTLSYFRGGMENEGFVSYGIEDVERMHRFIKLGFKVGWGEHYIYHIEHMRGHNSNTQNPHFAQNQALWQLLQPMGKDGLFDYYIKAEYRNKYTTNPLHILARINGTTPDIELEKQNNMELSASAGKKILHESGAQIFFMCYADGAYQPAQELLRQQAYKTNAFNEVYAFSDINIPDVYYHRHSYILSHKKGYCLWKPYFILRLLKERMKDNDILLYVDSADTLEDKGTPGLKQTMLNLMAQSPMHFTTGGFKNSDYTKRDCFVGMQCDTPEYHNALQLENGIILLKKTEATIRFVTEWLSYCEVPALITNDPNVLGKPNLPGFVEHRWNQSIMTNLAIKYNIPQSHGLRRFITCNVNDPK